MNLIYTRRLAQSYAEYIHKRVGRTPVNVLRYAIEDFIDNSIVALTVILMSALTGNLLNAVVAVTAFFILRPYSGGFHFAKDTHCMLFSILIILVSIYMPREYWYNGIIENIVAFVLIVLYAPSGSKAPVSLHKRYKLYSTIIVGSNFFIQSPLLSNVFVILAISTIPVIQAIICRYKL